MTAKVPSDGVVVLPFRSALLELYEEESPGGAPMAVESAAGCVRGLRDARVVAGSPQGLALETDPARAARIARAVSADAVVIGTLYTQKFSQTVEVELVRAGDGAVVARARSDGGGPAILGRKACTVLLVDGGD